MNVPLTTPRHPITAGDRYSGVTSCKPTWNSMQKSERFCKSDWKENIRPYCLTHGTEKLNCSLSVSKKRTSQEFWEALLYMHFHFPVLRNSRTFPLPKQRALFQELDCYSVTFLIVRMCICDILYYVRSLLSFKRQKLKVDLGWNSKVILYKLLQVILHWLVLFLNFLLNFVWKRLSL